MFIPAKKICISSGEQTNRQNINVKKDKYYNILEKSEYQCLETKARSSQTPQKSWFESQGPAKRSVSYGLKTEFNIAYCHV